MCVFSSHHNRLRRNCSFSLLQKCFSSGLYDICYCRCQNNGTSIFFRILFLFSILNFKKLFVLFCFVIFSPGKISNESEREKEDLKAAAGVGGGGVVDHLENEGSAGPHLDFTDVEPEP